MKFPQPTQENKKETTNKKNIKHTLSTLKKRNVELKQTILSLRIKTKGAETSYPSNRYCKNTPAST